MTSTSLHSLVAREMSGDDDCRSFDADNQAEPISGSLTFHNLITYIAAAALGICCISTFAIILGHIFNYRRPRIQKQLIRMVAIMPVFAIFCFFGVLSYHLTNYFFPIAALYEAFAIVAVFYLMIAMLTPDAGTFSEQHAFFAQPENGGSAMFTKTYIAVMQLLPGRIILTIASIVITAVDCVGGKTYKHGHTIISILNGIQAIIALIALLRFLKKWIRQLKVVDDRIVGKLTCFKLIVALEFLQNIIFKILGQTSALNGTKTLSYNDLNNGLPALILTVESAILGLAMAWAYSHGQFRHHRINAQSVEAGKDGQVIVTPPNQKLSPLRAIWDAIDMLDVVAGMYRAVKLFAGRKGRGPSHAAPAQAYAPRGQAQQYQAPPATYQAYSPPRE